MRLNLKSMWNPDNRHFYILIWFKYVTASNSHNILYVSEYICDVNYDQLINISLYTSIEK